MFVIFRILKHSRKPRTFCGRGGLVGWLRPAYLPPVIFNKNEDTSNNCIYRVIYLFIYLFEFAFGKSRLVLIPSHTSVKITLKHPLNEFSLSCLKPLIQLIFYWNFTSVKQKDASIFQPSDECCGMDRLQVTSLILLNAILQALTYGMSTSDDHSLYTKLNHFFTFRKRLEMIYTGKRVIKIENFVFWWFSGLLNIKQSIFYVHNNTYIWKHTRVTHIIDLLIATCI